MDSHRLFELASTSFAYVSAHAAAGVMGWGVTTMATEHALPKTVENYYEAHDSLRANKDIVMQQRINHGFIEAGSTQIAYDPVAARAAETQVHIAKQQIDHSGNVLQTYDLAGALLGAAALCMYVVRTNLKRRFAMKNPAVSRV